MNHYLYQLLDDKNYKKPNEFTWVKIYIQFIWDYINKNINVFQMDKL